MSLIANVLSYCDGGGYAPQAASSYQWHGSKDEEAIRQSHGGRDFAGMRNFQRFSVASPKIPLRPTQLALSKCHLEDGKPD